jgi:thiol-disulfide isomerase/thioredoxin
VPELVPGISGTAAELCLSSALVAPGLPSVGERSEDLRRDARHLGVFFWIFIPSLNMPTKQLTGSLSICLHSSMAPRTVLLRGAIPCILILTALCALAGPKDKEPAPRFNATTTTGEKFTNDSIKGKVVLLEFWTTWCGFCADEAAFVDKIGQEFAVKGLILLAIDVGESKKIVKKYLEQHPRNCKIVMMEDTNLAAMYQANVYPIYVVIDRDGNIAGTQRGAGGEEALRSLIGRAGLESPDSD